MPLARTHTSGGWTIENFGATSRADGLRILVQVGRSLARLHLTPNAAKSRLLSFEGSETAFPLRLKSHARIRLRRVGRTRTGRGENYDVSCPAFGQRPNGSKARVSGKRYLSGSICWLLERKVKCLRGRAYVDLVRYPELAPRLADYMRWTGSAAEYIAFSQRAWTDAEQVYDDVNVILTEKLLLLETNAKQSAEVRRIGSGLLSGRCGACQWGESHVRQ